MFTWVEASDVHTGFNSLEVILNTLFLAAQRPCWKPWLTGLTKMKRPCLRATWVKPEKQRLLAREDPPRRPPVLASSPHAHRWRALKSHFLFEAMGLVLTGGWVTLALLISWWRPRGFPAWAMPSFNARCGPWHTSAAVFTQLSVSEAAGRRFSRSGGVRSGGSASEGSSLQHRWARVHLSKQHKAVRLPGLELPTSYTTMRRENRWWRRGLKQMNRDVKIRQAWHLKGRKLQDRQHDPPELIRNFNVQLKDLSKHVSIKCDTFRSDSRKTGRRKARFFPEMSAPDPLAGKHYS